MSLCQDEIDEMIRCVSRASRPGSQSSSRPQSQQSRPSSALPKKVAKQLESLGSPERDSPVLTPRLRHSEMKDKQLESVKNSLYSPRAATPVQTSPVRTLVNENYFRKNEVTLGKYSSTLGAFEMAFTRKKQSEKIKKLLEKQKRKSEKLQHKKYQGFGDKAPPVDEDTLKKERKEQKKREQVVKKAAVSQEESDLMKELLKLGETAVADSQSSQENNSEPDPGSASCSKSVAAIQHFEESQTIDGSQNLSEELDKLFEL